jgi:hypothetical protein
MTRRRFLFLSLAAVVVVLAVAWLLWPRTAITRENAAKIQVGMTLAEVRAILGGKPRDESNGRLDLEESEDLPDLLRHARVRQWIDCATQADFDPDGGARGKWQSNEVVVYIWWDAAGTVQDCSVFPLRRTPESPLAMVRRWLGL